MLISRLAHPVTNLGHGVRAGIWTQGCTIGCPGCMARDTWPHRPETNTPPEVIAGWLLGIDIALEDPDSDEDTGAEPQATPEPEADPEPAPTSVAALYGLDDEDDDDEEDA